MSTKLFTVPTFDSIKNILNRKTIEELNNNVEMAIKLENKEINRISDSQEIQEDLQEKINNELAALLTEISENEDVIDGLIEKKITEFTIMMRDPNYVNFLDKKVDEVIRQDKNSKIPNVLSGIYKKYIPDLIATCEKIIETLNNQAEDDSKIIETLNKNNEAEDDSKIKLKEIIVKIKDYLKEKYPELKAKAPVVKVPMKGGIVLATGVAGVFTVLCSIASAGLCAIIPVVVILGIGLGLLYFSNKNKKKIKEASSQELQEKQRDINIENNTFKRIGYDDDALGGKKQKRNTRRKRNSRRIIKNNKKNTRRKNKFYKLTRKRSKTSKTSKISK